MCGSFDNLESQVAKTPHQSSASLSSLKSQPDYTFYQNILIITSSDPILMQMRFFFPLES